MICDSLELVLLGSALVALRSFATFEIFLVTTTCGSFCYGFVALRLLATCDSLESVLPGIAFVALRYLIICDLLRFALIDSAFVALRLLITSDSL